MTWQDPFLAGPYEHWPWLLVDSSSCVFSCLVYIRTYTALSLSEHSEVLVTMLWLLAVADVATYTRTECSSGKRLLLGL